MWTGRFDPAGGIVWLDVRVSGPLGERNLDCILDTGTPRTILDTAILDSLGYGAGMGTRIVSVAGVGGSVPSYELPLTRFSLMGLELMQFLVFSQDILPAELGVDGLIGMDVLAGRILTIDSGNGTVSLSS